MEVQKAVGGARGVWTAICQAVRRSEAGTERRPRAESAVALEDNSATFIALMIERCRCALDRLTVADTNDVS